MDKISRDFGLELPSYDIRDFVISAVSPIKKINYIVGEPLNLRNQGDTDMCTAFALVAIAEDVFGIQFSPEYTFAKICEMKGNTKWGADPKIALKAVYKFGFLPKINSPYYLSKYGRDFIADWNNWDRSLDDIAGKYKLGYYKKVVGYNLFENISTILLEKKKSVFVGALWSLDWNTKNGIIPEDARGGLIPHSFKIYGQKMIENKLYLIAQVSNGVGIYYFPEEQVNEFLFAYVFVEEKGEWNILQKLIHKILILFKKH